MKAHIFFAFVVFAAGTCTTRAEEGLDTRFGIEGYAFSDVTLASLDLPSKPVVQTDGKVLICETGSVNRSGESVSSYDTDFVVTRFMTNGTLDNGFGSAGHAFIDFDRGQDTCSDIAIDAEGRIVVVGSSTQPADGSYRFLPAVARLNPDGSADATFGEDVGRIVLHQLADDDHPIAAKRLLIQDDGRLLVTADVQGGGSVAVAFVTTRLDANGRLDTTFADHGSLRLDTEIGETDFIEFHEAGTIDGNRLIVVGSSTRSLILTRFTRDGRIDGTFGDLGRTTIPADQTGLDTMAVLPDGRLVLATGEGFCGLGADHVLLRVMPDGRLDPTFGEAGRLILNRCSALVGIAPQADGSLVLAFEGNGGSSIWLIGHDGMPDHSFDLDLPTGASPAPFGSGLGNMIANGPYLYLSGYLLESSAYDHALGLVSVVARIERAAAIPPSHSSRPRPALVPPAPARPANRLR